MHPEDQFAKRLLKAGASGYLTKDSAPNDIINALYKISSGGKYITESVAEILASDFDNSIEKEAHEILSEREFQVLCLIAEGKSQKEIADLLSLSSTTISTYRNRIFNKLNFKSTANLIKYALDKKLIQ